MSFGCSPLLARPTTESDCIELQRDQRPRLAGVLRYREDQHSRQSAPLEESANFAPLDRAALNSGFRSGATWLSLCVRAAEAGEYRLTIRNSFLETVDFLVFPPGAQQTPQIVHAGLRSRRNDRVPALDLDLQRGEERHMLVRVESRSPIRGSISLLPRLVAQRESRIENYFFGLSLGLTGGVALWTILLALRARIEGGFWFLIFLLLFGIYRSFYQGFPLLLSDSSILRQEYLRLSIALALGSLLSLARWQLMFLDLERISAVAARIVGALFWTSIALLLFNLLQPYTANRIVYIWATAAPVAASLAAWLYWRGGGDHGRSFFLASIVTMGLSLYFVLTNIGFARQSLLSDLAIEAATLVQAAIIAIMMGDRMRRLQTLRQHELEREVSARTEALAVEVNERVAAQRRAEEAARSQARFLANMSHEIRTPMNSILGMVELLQETTLSEEQKRYVEAVRGGGSALLRILNDVLDISRIEAGRMEVQPEEVDLRKIIPALATMHEAAFRARRIGLEVHFDADAPGSLVTDPGRLGQILINLLNNALKFTERGAVSLRVSMAERKGAPAAAIAVSDTGEGISVEMQTRIFERFQQGAGEPRGGAGLGLSIARELTALLGGELELKSEPGKGSVFTLCLPLAWQGRGGALQASAVSLAGNDASLLQGRRILIVDDAVDNRALFSRFLEKCGAECVLASDGEEALQALLAQRIDLALMDLQMPGMDGFECLSRLRELQRSGSIAPLPVLAITAFAMGDEYERAKRSDFQEILTKPTPRVALVSAVHHALRGASAASPGA
ncbi:MAG: response regulator [Leptospirales bacterium]|nr:response regulator [Leptospirales bacterium]